MNYKNLNYEIETGMLVSVSLIAVCGGYEL